MLAVGKPIQSFQRVTHILILLKQKKKGNKFEENIRVQVMKGIVCNIKRGNLFCNEAEPLDVCQAEDWWYISILERSQLKQSREWLKWERDSYMGVKIFQGRIVMTLHGED